MNKSVWVIIFLILSSLSQAQTGYKIDVSIKQFANQYIYLGYYYGKSLPIKDSIKLNSAGKGTFKGKEKLKGGIYLIGYPNKKSFVEVLIDKTQIFSVTITDTSLPVKMTVANTPEGMIFQQYQKYMEKKGAEAKAINQLPNTTEAEKQIVTSKRKVLNEEVMNYRKNIQKQHPKNLLSSLLYTLEEPKIPDAKFHPGGVYDSSYAWYFYKSNYWNGVDFTDERLLNTPVFEPKFDNYFETMIVPSIDSLKKEANKIIIASKPNKEMFKYITSKLIERYINPKYMGQDAVFVDLFEKYVSNGTVDWFTEKQKKFVFERYYYIVSNQVGEKAPPLELIDTLNKPVSLYNINSKYTVLCFWDATCGHCKEVVPKVDSVFTKKWKSQGVTLLGVMTDGGLDNWKKYISENKFTSWMHAYQADEVRKAEAAEGKPNFRQLYDVQVTPKLYLLDSEKRIIAKNLTWDQIDNVIEDQIKRNRN
jgi:peroxiredoxin